MERRAHGFGEVLEWNVGLAGRLWCVPSLANVRGECLFNAGGMVEADRFWVDGPSMLYQVCTLGSYQIIDTPTRRESRGDRTRRRPPMSAQSPDSSLDSFLICEEEIAITCLA